ncbi:inorganic phosphate transporter PiT [Thermoclostridium stercorarium subsp. thermolacticum DSM 2910]|uniref:Inorganic phosphate transporter PiT n=2 Tax=Thermoclostridium stercorarium TaxID=1510 RepID=A0A1B1YPJ1_THEST|nr:inorganic phosphate transporter PiT [Thermoclostridium stercorarium subsp. thermolacticum DSM 2910]ANX02632.1 inorganic phosphate transporter PiT [Thermoclostridium stercorarium subsp. leptospartum DSM 9219]
MGIELNDFLQQFFSNPALAITVILTLGVIFVNGWTDAPNAIATSISTRSMGPRAAIIMAAIFNFFGVLVMTLFNSMVAQTIYSMVDFGGNPHDALVSLCAALFAIVLWATAAWWFGIPTSESHALIAGITGAAIAVQGGLAGINPREWVKVIYGLFLSLFMGFIMGWIIVKLVELIFRNFNRRKTSVFFQYAQIVGSAGMAFMHGAQDGQKFMGVFLLGVFLAQGRTDVTEFEIPIWLIFLCSVVMALGTSIGGYRIIKAVGMDMVKLEKYQGFSADLASSLSLFIASVFGLPVSTTHTKTTSIMGVGAAKRLSNVNWGVVKDMVSAWVLTFPGCGIIGFLMAKLFMLVF